MKKLLWPALCLILASFIPGPAAQAASFTGGLLAQDTTLTASGGPYLLTQAIQIPAGVTLTLEPGTVIRANGANALFWVNGTLNSMGTADLPVRFIGSHLTGTVFYTRDAGSACHIHLSHTYVDGMNRASLVVATGYGQSCDYNLEDSEFVRLPDWSYFWYPNGLQVRRNVFVNFGGFSIGYRSSQWNQPVLENNLFIGGPASGGALIGAWAAYDGQLVVRNNEFRGGAFRAIEASSTYGNNTLDARSNYWGTTDTSIIKTMIMDNTKSMGFGGPIDVSGALSSPPSGTPTYSKMLLEPQPQEAFSSTPVPTIAGSPYGDEQLWGNAGAWDSPAHLSYQWLRNGQPIQGATTANYITKSADIGCLLSLQVVGSADGYITSTQVSADFGPIVAKALAEPIGATISGVLKVGKTLTAISGVWTPSTNISYQWLRDQIPIDGATTNVYNLTSLDLARLISVRISGSREGYATLTRVVDASAIVSVGNLVSTPTPFIVGSNAVGSTLSLSGESWDNGVTFEYNWLLDGQPVQNAIQATYQVQPADLGKQISVSITARKIGFASVSLVTARTMPVVKGTLQPHSAPVLSGDSVVGGKLLVDAGTWEDGVELSYQWAVNGLLGPATKNSAYQVKLEDFGLSISVTVTASKNGYETVTATSNPTPSVAKNHFSGIPVPTIAGRLILGGTLTAESSGWPSNTELSYKWFRSGSNVSVGTGASYKVQDEDLGHTLSFVVGATKPGYENYSLASSDTSPVALAKFSTTGTIKIVGLARVGQSLSALPGTWESETKLTYSWLADGVPIPGAANNTFLISPSQLGKRISVQVTGSKYGFVDTAAESGPSSQVELGVLSDSVKAHVLGSGKVAGVLTASVENLPADSYIVVSWFRDGKEITQPGSVSYTLQSSDLGSEITASITARSPGYKDAVLVALEKVTVMPGILVLGSPRISGKPSVGRSISVNLQNLPSGAVVSYQWMMDAKVVKGAKGPSIKILPTYKGHKLLARCIISLEGFEMLTLNSPSVKVP